MNGLDKQVKNGPSLTEALENAGIFYEAQYKEVKVVANVSNSGCFIFNAYIAYTYIYIFICVYINTHTHTTLCTGWFWVST